MNMSMNGPEMGGSEEFSANFDNEQPTARDFDSELLGMFAHEEFPDVFSELGQVFATKAAANSAASSPETKALARQRFIDYFITLYPKYDHASYTRQLEDVVDPGVTDEEFGAMDPDDLEMSMQLDVFIGEIQDPQIAISGQETPEQKYHFDKLKLAYAADLWFTYDEHSIWLIKMLDVIRPEGPMVAEMDRVELEAEAFLALGRSSRQIRFFANLNEIMAEKFAQVLGPQLTSAAPEISDVERLGDVIILAGTIEGMRHWEQDRIDAGALALTASAAQSIENYDDFRLSEAERHAIELAEGAGIPAADLATRIQPFVSAVSLFTVKSFRMDYAGEGADGSIDDDPDFRAWYGSAED